MHTISDNHLKVLLLSAMLVASSILNFSFAQIGLPTDDDKYSNFVKQLEAGDTTVSFKGLRMSSLERKANASAALVASEYIRTAGAAFGERKYDETIAAATNALTLNYISLAGHFYLSQAYHQLGDLDNSAKYSRIFSGLITSILDSGDGKTCESAWQVVSINEEYFVLNFLGIRPGGQALIMEGSHTCDKMSGTDNVGATVTRFFGIDSFFGKAFK